MKGTHNSLTSYPLYGWQKLLTPVLNLFCRCQNKNIAEQYESGVRVYDIQLTYGKAGWRGSHGLALYDVNPIEILHYLNDKSDKDVYIFLGLDKSLFSDKRLTDLFKTFSEVFSILFPNLILARVYNEITGESEEFVNLSNKVHERYWSKSWAKSKKKHWWQFWYYLPIPWLWKKLYSDEWKIEAQGKELMTDFV